MEQSRGPTISNSQFLAAAPAAGYLYQARLALALSLRYAYGDAAVDVAIERLDDVSFDHGSAVELLQTKHHIKRTASLSDTSPDLWKTLRIWSERAQQDPAIPIRTRLTLVTTGISPPNSVAALLSTQDISAAVPGTIAKDAATALTAVAEKSENKALEPCFRAFLALHPRMRASLLSAVQILDGQPRLQELGAVIEDRIRFAAPRGKVSAAREMLEGWWWPRVCDALVQAPSGSISVLELEIKLDEIRETLLRDGLTTNFDDAEPHQEDLSAYEAYGFVRQLQAIGLGGNRIEYAKRDYYRAYSQRSSWSRHRVVLDEEITTFERTLIEEWQPRFASMCDRHATEPVSETALRAAGQEIYHWVETEARFPFRSLVRRFLNVGSFHMLANDLRVGWHRDFRALLRAKNDE